MMGNNFTMTPRDEMLAAYRVIEFCRQVEAGNRPAAPSRLDVAAAADYLRKFAPARSDLIAATMEVFIAPIGATEEELRAEARNCREAIENILKSMNSDASEERVRALMPPIARPVPKPAANSATSAIQNESHKGTNDSKRGSPTGFLGGAELADALGIHATRRDAFFRQLERQRMSIGDDCWHEVRDSRPNNPKFLYRVDSPKLRDLAAGYKTPKPA